jgi:GDP-mannose 6-dehydrogenase
LARVAVFGLGYVGCVTAGCLSRDGHDVVGVDISDAKVDMVRSGIAPVSEPGLETLLEQGIRSGRLRATTDVREAIARTDLALIAVGTPSAADGSVETRAVEAVVRQIGAALAESNQEYVIVVRSTLLPGVLEEQLGPALEESSGSAPGHRIHLCNNPEFLRETTAIRDYDRPPFVLVGADDEAIAERVCVLYQRVGADPIVADTRTAALVKYACNAFHALKVVFANEIGTLAQSLETDGRKVMEIVCRDHHLNISPAYLRPGFAFGGSCLPKDVRALTRLAEQRAIATELLSSLLPSNESHLRRAVRMIQQTGARRIGLVGLSFKAGTDDLRESPLVHLAETLLGRGYRLQIYDPGVRMVNLVGRNLHYVDEHLPHLSALLVPEPEQLYEHAELLVLGNDIADKLNWEQAYQGEVLDLRRDLIAPKTERLAVS